MSNPIDSIKNALSKEEEDINGFRFTDERAEVEREYFIDSRKDKTRNPTAEQIKYWEAQKAIRPEKVEEIKAIWDSPNFKTNNQRLVYLLRHCKDVKHGYTIREFAYAIYSPTEQYQMYDSFKLLHQMFRRFRRDVRNHEIVFYSIPDKFDRVRKWYYYNMIEDDKAYKEVDARQAKVYLGITKSIDRNNDILEMSEKERKQKTEELSEQIRQENIKRMEKRLAAKRKAKKHG